ncbi:hypothetical protein Ani05nite_15040 [Amorphoplanes nipponensis]|uniref:Exo-alpha-sialidase n=2 Tax=Actinoplanes nipponensis TaxID=135950 RepID=A0A919JEP8_9ACTN|nr:hypothetical protein Ani05nite_15040 [Actinoplanes nipponensis]
MRRLAGIAAAALLTVGSAACRSGPEVDWARVHPVPTAEINGSAPLDPAALVAGTPGFVLAGVTHAASVGPEEPFPGEPYSAAVAFSPDGHTWRRPTREAFETAPGSYATAVTALVWFRKAYWAFGTERGSEDATVTVWRSVDGERWARAARVPDVQHPGSLTVGEVQGRLLLLSYRYRAPTQWWQSSDGARWQPGPSPLGTGSAGAPTKLGVLVFGSEPDARGVVYKVRPDGVTDISARLRGVRHARGAVTVDGRTVVVGEARSASGRTGVPGAWRTGDGEHWQASTGFELGNGLVDPRVEAVGPAGHGFLAVGRAGPAGGLVGMAWTSPDGERWKVLGRPPSAELIAPAYRAGRVVVAGKVLVRRPAELPGAAVVTYG